MELFLNLCWLALLLPAYALWRRKVSSARTTHASLTFICTLGCVIVLLFPVISASDDLHSIGQAMEEESKRTLCDGSHHVCPVHSIASSLHPALPASASIEAALAQVGSIAEFSPHSVAAFFISRPTGRAPPAARSASL